MSKNRVSLSELQFEQLIEISDSLSMPNSIKAMLERYMVKGENPDDICRYNGHREAFDNYLEMVRDSFKDAMDYTAPARLSKGVLTEQQCDLLCDMAGIPNTTRSNLKDYYAKGKLVDFDESWMNWSEYFQVAHNELMQFRSLCKKDPSLSEYLKQQEPEMGLNQ